MTMNTKTLFKATALALATISTPAILSAPAAAQSRTGIAVANYEAAVVQSQAYRTAMTQMQTTYKADIDATNARATALQAELKPLVDAYNAARQQGATAASLQSQTKTLQDRSAAGQQELGRLRQRVTLADAYVQEQVGAKLNDAIKTAMKAKKVDLVLQPNAVMAREPYVDITSDVVLELNKLVPSVSIVPPAGWRPGQQQQQAAQPAAAQPSGR